MALRSPHAEAQRVSGTEGVLVDGRYYRALLLHTVLVEVSKQQRRLSCSTPLSTWGHRTAVPKAGPGAAEGWLLKARTRMKEGCYMEPHWRQARKCPAVAQAVGWGYFPTPGAPGRDRKTIWSEGSSRESQNCDRPCVQATGRGEEKEGGRCALAPARRRHG